MSNRRRSFWPRILFAVSLTLVLACDLQLTPTAVSPTVQPTDTVLPSASPVPATETASPTATLVPPTLTLIPPSSTPPPTSSVTAAPLTVKAVGGNLNIRRGPGQSYNPVGALLAGQSSTATARNDDASWLYISIPFSAGEFGWVSTKTQYSTVTGNMMFLPIMAVPPAEPAYIRNCTFHVMLVKPAGVVLPDQTSSPNNKQRFFPGEYTVLDQSTASKVADFILLEGKSVDIRKDGLGNSYSCP